MRIEIKTKKDLKHYLKICKIVYCTVRFGTNDSWSKLSKIEAGFLIESLKDDATPQSAEMYGDSFADYDLSDGALYLS